MQPSAYRTPRMVSMRFQPGNSSIYYRQKIVGWGPGSWRRIGLVHAIYVLAYGQVTVIAVVDAEVGVLQPKGLINGDISTSSGGCERFLRKWKLREHLSGGRKGVDISMAYLDAVVVGISEFCHLGL